MVSLVQIAPIFIEKIDLAFLLKALGEDLHPMVCPMSMIERATG